MGGFLLTICLFWGHETVSVHTQPLSPSMCHCGRDGVVMGVWVVGVSGGVFFCSSACSGDIKLDTCIQNHYLCQCAVEERAGDGWREVGGSCVDLA